MREFGKNVALAAKAFAPHLAVLMDHRQLQRNVALDTPVNLTRQPHLAHAAAAQRAQ